MIPLIGRTVLFIVQDTGLIRPAVIVNVHAGESPATETTVVNLQVFMDSDGRGFGDRAQALAWKTSVAQGTARGQWFDPLRPDAPKAPVPAAPAPEKPAASK